jgi:aminoglycoside phosphotransferase (APT) family kinase protein
VADPYDAAVTEPAPEPTSDSHDSLAARFGAWLEQQVGGRVSLGPLVSPTHGGLSNDTMLVEADWGDGARRLVLRLAPGGTPLFPRYDLGLQISVLRALGAHTDIPVPEVLWDQPDPEPLGRPFYVMAHVDGRIPPDNPGTHFDGWVKDLPATEQSVLFDDSMAMFARIHRVDWRSAGLDLLDRPEHGDDPITQELGAWRAYLDWASDGERLDLLEDAYDWCVANRPTRAVDRALVWGDARLGNIIYDAALAPRAVIDWEMAVLGPPELDLGWYLFLERTALQFVEQLPGFPDRAGAVQRYEQHLGRPMRDLEWYEAWGGMRAACIQVRLGRILFELGVIDDERYRQRNPVTKALRGLIG